ncbi:hypothetical protein ACI2L4_05385 [Streptomyces sparsogenes]|uniref:Uncharacterized protein n=1 Tax=Streptomyces cuspidosporus TaxID=66882 RepID=A0ABN3GVR7_9ACTN
MSTSDSERKKSILRSLTRHLLAAFTISAITALISGYVDLATGAEIVESLKNIWSTFYEVATLCILVLTLVWAVRLAVILKA